jgi:hypothetical protein
MIELVFASLLLWFLCIAPQVENFTRNHHAHAVSDHVKAI